MGYLLEFYSLDWSELRGLLGSGGESTFEETLAAGGRVFAGSPGARENWQAALRDLLAGQRGPELAARGPEPLDIPPEEPTAAEALALVAVLRAHFDRVGEIIHTTRGGPKFRHMFTPDFTPALFNSADLLGMLLERPLFGLAPRNYPFWGGLKKEELAQLVGGRAGDELPPVRDPDYEIWLYQLNELLLDAAARQTDLVTLYL